MNRRALQKIHREYDPENDVGDGIVTWQDELLADELESTMDLVERLVSRIDALEGWLEYLENKEKLDRLFDDDRPDSPSAAADDVLETGL